MASFQLLNSEPARNTSLLKKHKILPRQTPGQYPDHSYLYSPSISSLDSDESASSTINSAPSIPHLPGNRALDLPPTPPSNRNSGSISASLPVSGSNRLTPPLHQSPPTPDDTPPHKNSQLRPPQPLRHAISATDSFRTALEEQATSEIEGSSLPSHSNFDTSFNVLPTYPPFYRSVPQRRSRDIGLGLGLESDVNLPLQSQIIVNVTPEPLEPAPAETISFDGNWGKDLIDVRRDDQVFGTETESNLMRNVTMRKKKAKRRNKVDPIPNQTLSIRPDSIQIMHSETQPLINGLSRGLSLRQRIERRKGIVESVSTERFAAMIEWPRESSELSADYETSDGDYRRYSSHSNSSTLVREAIVVDTLPTRARTLRHSQKTGELRRAASSSENKGATSDHLQFRRGRQSEYKDRRTNTLPLDKPVPLSNFYIADISARGEINNYGLKTSPERKSSLRRKAAFTRSQSVNVPAPSSINKNDNDDKNRSDSRRSQMGMQKALSLSKHMDERTIDFAPQIPKRASSLSAPTSRANSRAASMTSNSFDWRPVVAETSGFDNASLRHTPEALSSSNSTIGNADERTLPTQVTPFSNPSSTPEALEVSQARAVNFYPHTNHSVNLVIQSNSRPTTSANDEMLSSEKEPHIRERGRIDTTTPPQKILDYPIAIHSPLKNPRRPPDPPQFMIIPPTPANASLAQNELPESPVHPPILLRSNKRFATNGPVSRIRRALSQKNRSESVERQSSRLQKPFPRRTFSLPKRRRTQIEKRPQTSSLHPLWRPRSFWEGFDDEREGEYVLTEEFLDRGWTPWLASPAETGFGGPEFRNNSEEGRTTAAEPVSIRPGGWFRRFSYDEESPKPLMENEKHNTVGVRSLKVVQSRFRALRERRNEKRLEQRLGLLNHDIGGRNGTSPHPPMTEHP